MYKMMRHFAGLMSEFHKVFPKVQANQYLHIFCWTTECILIGMKELVLGREEYCKEGCIITGDYTPGIVRVCVVTHDF